MLNANEGDIGSTRLEPPLISSKGLYLPSWALAFAITSIIGVVTLAAESRVRLAQHEATLQDLQKSLSDVRAEARNERDRVVDELTKLKVTLAAICAATGAKCP